MWDWLWEKHEQTKELLSLFAKPAKLMDNLSKSREKAVKSEEPNQYKKRSYETRQLIGLFLGPLLFVLTLLFFDPQGLTPEGRAVLASTFWIGTWWITEAIPIPVTSFLPIILFPLTGALDGAATASSYADPIIFLIIGGFIIALAMEKWGLHKRIALGIVSLCGTSPQRVVLAFIVATGFLSMWISNTATTMMMVPIGMAMIKQVADSLKYNNSVDTNPENFPFGKAMMLGIAYAASIGGLGTIVGSPPNAILVAVVNELYGIKISFAQWMLVGAPVAAIFLLITWFYLVKVAYPMKIKDLPGGRELIQKEKEKLGKASAEEKMVFTVFVLTGLAWISSSFLLSKFIPGINDGMIAIMAVIVLFVIPSINKPGDHLLDWNTAMKLPWGMLIMYGCGLTIAAGFVKSGLSEFVGQQLAVMDGMPLFLVIFIIVAMCVFLTEFTSNTATATLMYPIMAAFALAMGVHPYVLLLAACIATSYAFMMPVGTPPNAIVYGTGYFRIPEMIRVGFWLNIVVIALIPLFIYFIFPILWGIDIHVFPHNLK
ncbi:anion transporter [Bacillus sp. Leaf13]|nr:anion transporter [Bacillus sp. Leaf13]